MLLPQVYLAVLGEWVAVFGLVGLIAMGVDKGRALSSEWRISEVTLLTVAIAGGFWGIVLGGILFHHKTSKLTFLLPSYGIAILWLSLLYEVGFLTYLAKIA